MAQSAEMLQSSTDSLDRVYCRSLFSIDGLPVSPRRLESGLRACRLNLVVYATHRRLRGTGINSVCLSLRALGRASPFDWPACGPPASLIVLENVLSSFIALFSAAALLATGLLFVLQMLEDFRDA
jgi:hypothetical protein